MNEFEGTVTLFKIGRRDVAKYTSSKVGIERCACRFLEKLRFRVIFNMLKTEEVSVIIIVFK